MRNRKAKIKVTTVNKEEIGGVYTLYIETVEPFVLHASSHLAEVIFRISDDAKFLVTR